LGYVRGGREGDVMARDEEYAPTEGDRHLQWIRELAEATRWDKLTLKQLFELSEHASELLREVLRTVFERWPLTDEELGRRMGEEEWAAFTKRTAKWEVTEAGEVTKSEEEPNAG
jgi:hypothetical protein